MSEEQIPTLISQGDAARDLRDWTVAEEAYGSVVELDSSLSGIWVQLGHALKENGKFEEAVKAYRQALALVPEDDDAHLQLGHVLKLAGDEVGALLAYRKSLQLNATSELAVSELKSLNFLLLEPRGGEISAGELAWIRSLISRADAARDVRDWTAAEAAYGAVVELDPGLGGIWVQFGHSLKENGRIDKAAEAYRQAIALDPEDDDAHLQLGHALKMAGDTAGALLAYRNSLNLNPTSAPALAEMEALKISNPAVQMIELEDRSEQLSRLISCGDSARDRRDWAAAEDAYRAVVELDPALGGMWVQLGHALKESGNLKDAADAYRQAVALDPEDDDAHLQLGHVLKLAGDTGGALMAYRHSLKINPTSEQAIAELRTFNSQNIQEPQRAEKQDPARIAQLVNELQCENELLSQQLQKELQKNLQLTRLGSGAGPRLDKYWKKYHSSLIIIDFRDEIEGDNWYPAVSAGRWAGPGERSLVRFPALRDGEYEIRLYIVDSADAELLEKIRISVNGIPVSPDRVAAGSAGIVSARFSTESLQNTPVWEFEFTFPSLGELKEESGNDPQKQTILMKSLTLKCTSEA